MTMKAFVTCSICCYLMLVPSHALIPFYDLERVIYPDPYYLEMERANSQPAYVGIHDPVEVQGWGADIPLGQVVGVTVDKDGNPVVLHRANRKWTIQSFNSTDHFQLKDAIKENVIVTIDAKTGHVIKSVGGGLFYLPHGITIDSNGNTWITDVALHQVFKFAPNSQTPSLTLGEKLIPGGDFKHFCKPTSVAVASSGDFFVADGYCNNRILKYTSEGVFIGQFGTSGAASKPDGLALPHGLALHEGLGALCIADRENARVVCVNAGLRKTKDFGIIMSEMVQKYQTRVFDIAFYGYYLLGVAGSENEEMSLGFTSDVMMETVLSLWGPLQNFHNPHAIATDMEHGSFYVAEIGPNKIWKFILKKKPTSE